MRAKNKALAHAILLVGLGSSFLYPQPSEFPLQPSKTVVATGVRWSMVVEPARCDAEGNVYVRQVLSSRRSRPLAGPALQISADGQNTRTFEVGAVPDEAVKNGDIQDFAGGKDGVYLLVSTRSSESSRYELIYFKADGSTKVRWRCRRTSPRSISPSSRRAESSSSRGSSGPVAPAVGLRKSPARFWSTVMAI